MLGFETQRKREIKTKMEIETHRETLRETERLIQILIKNEKLGQRIPPNKCL